MGGTHLEERSRGGPAGETLAMTPRWLAWREDAEETSSGRLASSLELFAERTDDGVLVAPSPGSTGGPGERIVWIADLVLRPARWPGRIAPPRVELVTRRDGRPEAALRWSGLPAGTYVLEFTVPCRPAGHLTFENDDFDGSVKVAVSASTTSLRLRPYEGLPDVELLVDRPARVSTGVGWERGVAVVETDGSSAFEDRFSPASVELEIPDGHLFVRAIAGDPSLILGGAQHVDAGEWPAWIADDNWCRMAGGGAARGFGAVLWTASQCAGAPPEPILEEVLDRLGSGPVWRCLEGLNRWDRPAAVDAPIAVEHAAQLLALLRRGAEARRGSAEGARIGRAADQLARWFRSAFWLSTPERLADRALGRRGHLGLRPHGLVAAALPEVPLSAAERRRVVGGVLGRLSCELGLRTLDPEDHDFDPGHPERGLVWPWLVSPLAAALSAGGIRDRRLVGQVEAMATRAARAPEAWRVAPGLDASPVPVGALVFPPNALAAAEAHETLAGGSIA